VAHMWLSGPETAVSTCPTRGLPAMHETSPTATSPRQRRPHGQCPVRGATPTAWPQVDRDDLLGAITNGCSNSSPSCSRASAMIRTGAVRSPAGAQPRRRRPGRAGQRPRWRRVWSALSARPARPGDRHVAGVGREAVSIATRGPLISAAGVNTPASAGPNRCAPRMRAQGDLRRVLGLVVGSLARCSHAPLLLGAQNGPPAIGPIIECGVCGFVPFHRQPVIVVQRWVRLGRSDVSAETEPVHVSVKLDERGNSGSGQPFALLDRLLVAIRWVRHGSSTPASARLLVGGSACRIGAFEVFGCRTGAGR